VWSRLRIDDIISDIDSTLKKKDEKESEAMLIMFFLRSICLMSRSSDIRRFRRKW
jgi:hypothetical protein